MINFLYTSVLWSNQGDNFIVYSSICSKIALSYFMQRRLSSISEYEVDCNGGKDRCIIYVVFQSYFFNLLLFKLKTNNSFVFLIFFLLYNSIVINFVIILLFYRTIFLSKEFNDKEKIELKINKSI